MIPNNKLLYIALEHRVNVAGLDAAANVFHQLVRVEHVVAYLAAERVLHALAAQRRQLFCALLLFELVELGAQNLERRLLVLQLRFLILAGHHNACGHVREAHGRIGGVHALTARPA